MAKLFDIPIVIDESMLKNKLKFVKKDGSEQVIDTETGELVIELAQS